MQRAFCAALAVCALGSTPALAGPPELRFLTAVRYPIGRGPLDVITADFNGDGNLDVALANTTPPTITVFLGAANGSLTRIADASPGGVPLGLAAGRFDADNVIDLVHSEQESNNVWLLRGRGDGTFVRQSNPIVAGHDPWPVLAVDFDRDGNLDIVQGLTSELGGRVNVIFGNGDGTFSSIVGSRTSGTNRSIDVADCNGDGLLDALAANSGPGSVSVLLGRQDETLAPRLDSPVGNLPTGIVAADVSGDGIVDVITANSGEDTVSLTQGSGDGRFLTPQFFEVGDTPLDLALGDVDADGRRDVVVANGRSGSVSLLSGIAGGFREGPSYVVDGDPTSITLADLNRDGHLDAVTGNTHMTDPSASVLFGTSGGLQGIALLPALGRATTMTVGDLDNDTRPDFLVSFPTARLLGLYRSRSGNPSTPVVLDPRGAANALALADVNGDGWLDVLSGNGAAQGVTALLSRRGAFPEAAQTVLPGVSATTLAAGDFNLDGRADVAVALDGEPRVLTLRGLGDGRFDAPVPTALTSTPVALAVGDFNEDGRPDLAVATETSNSITLLLANANGFTATTPRTLSEAPLALVTLDAEGNGHLDVATPLRTGGVALLRGDGQGALSAPSIFSAPSTFTEIAARDLNGDLRPEIVGVDETHHRLGLLLNDGAASYSAAMLLPVGRTPSAAGAADIDDDGDYDLLGSGNQPAVVTNLVGGSVLRGDVNADERLTASDLTAFFRTVSSRAQYPVEIYADLSPDANGDGIVSDQDPDAIVTRIFASAAQRNRLT